MERKIKTVWIILIVVFILFCSLKYYTTNESQPVYLGPLGKEMLDKPYCTVKNVSLSEKRLPSTGLVSFPGSGNTWARHLTQQMTGLGTSSVYCATALKVNGFPYECYGRDRTDKDRAIVVKTHLPDDIRMFKKIVFLIRNPYDAFLSFASYASDGLSRQPSKEKLKNTCAKLFKESLVTYTNLVKTLTEKFKGPVHIIQYDRLKADLATELRRLAKFLEVNVTDRDISCTVKLQEGNFHHRYKDVNDYMELLRWIYSKDQLLRIQETKRFAEKRLKDAYGIDVDLRGTARDMLFTK